MQPLHRFVVATVCLAPAARAQTFATGFESAGASGGVYALTTFNDGTGARLYAAGEFEAVGSVVASRVARWNGVSGTWAGVGGGIDGRVGALASFDEDGAGGQPARLFAAGRFSLAGTAATNNIARWNGAVWTPLGAGVDDQVSALALYDDDGTGPRPQALYAGGLFRTAGGLPANSIARFSNGLWEPLGPGLNGPVTCLAAFDFDGAGPQREELYVGGHFTRAGALTVNQIARWNGLSWQPVGSGVDIAESSPSVNALAVFDEDGVGGQPARLFVGGSFAFSGGVNTNGIARWNGFNFSALSSGLTANGSFPNVRALAALNDGSGTRLYAAGLFRSVGTATTGTDPFDATPLLSVARWDGGAWTTLGVSNANNANGVGRALAAFDDNVDGTPSLFVGGFFTTAGSGAAAGVARWNGTTWAALGSGRGMNSDVLAFASPPGGAGTPLFAGGSFTTAGNVIANRVAAWNDSAQVWQPLGLGLDDTVRAVEFHAGALYAGGDFDRSGSTPTRRVAQWNGSAWVEVGGGIDGRVHALKSFGNGGLLVAGGSFQHAGGALTGNVAGWTGTTWIALPNGPDDIVRTLEVFEEIPGVPFLFAGGDFSRVGNVAANGIARWNGSSWSPLGGGLCCGGVYDLAVFDDGQGPRLYAAGEIDIDGNGRNDGVLRWNSSTLSFEIVGSSFAGGAPTRISALARATLAGVPVLVAGGRFGAAGGTLAQNLASWNGLVWSALGSGMNDPVLALRSHAVAVAGEALFVGGSFTIADGRPSARFARSN